MEVHSFDSVMFNFPPGFFSLLVLSSKGSGVGPEKGDVVGLEM